MKVAALIAAAALALSACVPAADVTTRRSDPTADALPAMKTFSGSRRRAVAKRSNADIARDFLDLSFALESGKPLERLTRFEGPISVSILSENPPSTLSHDLDVLLGRLRHEAGIDIARARDGSAANVSITLVPRRELQRAVPQAACFVVPRVSTWKEFRANRTSGQLDWTTLTKRERVAIFVPSDVAPQEMRDCLHEEIAQALGPVNDLYRLADSVFNDDNMHAVLTGFDMLVLRTTYDRGLANGMTRTEAARVLPGILARLNPSGEGVAPARSQRIDRPWNDAIETALGPRTPSGRRVVMARRALQIAEDANWRDNRLGYSLFALGRLSLGVEARTAAESFAKSYAVYTALYGKDDIHAAHVAMQLSAFALSAGEGETAERFVDASIPAALEAENAALLASLLMIKAEALELQGKTRDARAVRLDSLGWGRYGFGSDEDLRRRASEIASLRPKRTTAGG